MSRTIKRNDVPIEHWASTATKEWWTRRPNSGNRFGPASRPWWKRHTNKIERQQAKRELK